MGSTSLYLHSFSCQFQGWQRLLSHSVVTAGTGSTSPCLHSLIISFKGGKDFVTHCCRYKYVLPPMNFLRKLHLQPSMIPQNPSIVVLFGSRIWNYRTMQQLIFVNWRCLIKQIVAGLSRIGKFHRFTIMYETEYRSFSHHFIINKTVSLETIDFY